MTKHLPLILLLGVLFCTTAFPQSREGGLFNAHRVEVFTDGNLSSIITRTSSEFVVGFKHETPTWFWWLAPRSERFEIERRESGYLSTRYILEPFGKEYIQEREFYSLNSDGKIETYGEVQDSTEGEVRNVIARLGNKISFRLRQPKLYLPDFFIENDSVFFNFDIWLCPPVRQFIENELSDVQGSIFELSLEVQPGVGASKIIETREGSKKVVGSVTRGQNGDISRLDFLDGTGVVVDYSQEGKVSTVRFIDGIRPDNEKDTFRYTYATNGVSLIEIYRLGKLVKKYVSAK